MALTERWLPPVGEVLQGRYHLVEFVGKGPIGAVYKAMDLALKRGVALKVIHPGFLDPERRPVNAFRLQRARAYQHPNIVSFHDLFLPEDDATPFFTEDLVEGLSLRTVQMLRRDAEEPLTAPEIRFVVEGVANALRWIHQLGVHGNLKPENIFLVGEAVRVTDPFFLIGRSKLRWLAGDLPLHDHYLAPEQLMRASEETRQSDLFALAMLIGEMVAGDPVRPGLPLSAQTAEVPDQLDELFVKATATDVVSRYASIDSFLADLRLAFPREGQRVVADLGDTTEVPLAEVLSAAEIEEIDAVRRQRSEEARARASWAPPAMPDDAVAVPEAEPLDGLLSGPLGVVELPDDEDLPWDHAPEHTKQVRALADEDELQVPPGDDDSEDIVTLDWEEDVETSAPSGYLSKSGATHADDGLLDRTMVDRLEDHDLALQELLLMRPASAAPALGPKEPPFAEADTEPDDQTEAIAAPAPDELSDEAEDLWEPELLPSEDALDVEAVPDLPSDANEVEILGDELDVALAEAALDDDEGAGEGGRTSAESLLELDAYEEVDADADMDIDGSDILVEDGDIELDDVAEVTAAADEDELDMTRQMRRDAFVPSLPIEAIDALPIPQTNEQRRRATDESPIVNRTHVIPQPQAEERSRELARSRRDPRSEETAHATFIPMPSSYESSTEMTQHMERPEDALLADDDEPIMLAGDDEEPILLEGDAVDPDDVRSRPTPEAVLQAPGRTYNEDETIDAQMADVLQVALRPHPRPHAAAPVDPTESATAAGPAPRAIATKAPPKGTPGWVKVAMAASVLLVIGAAIYTVVQQTSKTTGETAKAGATAAGSGEVQRKPGEGGGTQQPVAIAALDAGVAKADAGSTAIAAAPDAGSVAVADATVAQADTSVAAATDTATTATGVDATQLASAEAEAAAALLAKTEAEAAAAAEAEKAAAEAKAAEAASAAKAKADAEKVAADAAAKADADKIAADSATKAEADKAAKAKADADKAAAEAKAKEAAKLAANSQVDATLSKAQIAAAAAKAKEEAALTAAEKAAKKQEIAEAKAKAAEDKRIAAEEKKRKKEEERLAREEAKRAKAEAIVASAATSVDTGGDLRCPGGMARIESKKTVTIAGRNVMERSAYCIERYEFPGKGSKPKTGVDWFGASKSCEGRGRRLCTSSEWKRACGGKYPYGKEYDPGACNTMGEGGEENDVRAAGSMKKCKSPYGLYDMSGNVSEWTADKTVNGGNSVDDDESATCSRSPKRFESSRSSTVGFRCCADPE